MCSKAHLSHEHSSMNKAVLGTSNGMRLLASSLGWHRSQRFVIARNPLGRLVYHRIRVIHAHAISTRVLPDDTHDSLISFFAGPIALPFEHDLLPGDWNDVDLYHALHRVVMGFFRSTGRGAGHDINCVAAVHRAHCIRIVAH